MTGDNQYPVLIIGTTTADLSGQLREEIEAEFPGYRIVLIAGMTGASVVTEPGDNVQL